MKTGALRVGVIGYGYWGPNLVRNFADIPGADVVAVCDLSTDRLARAQTRHPGIDVTTDARALLSRPDVDAVAIATPVSTHFDLAHDALLAGKHVLVEKPLAASSDRAGRLIDAAARRRLVLMVDHTFVYSGAVRAIQQCLADEGVGEVLYYDSVRINLGLFQHDVNVLWDLAVHDLAIMDYLLPQRPVAVSATGMRHVASGPENIAYVTLFFNGTLIAHVHANWLAPVKVRQTLIGGTKRMIVYNDLEPIESVRIYEKGIVVTSDPESLHQMRINYRTGDMWAPTVDPTEALRTEALHFVQCVTEGTPPITDGEAGLRVVRILEAATASVAERGRPVALSRLERHRMIPFVDLAAQYRSIRSEVSLAVDRVLESGHFVLGPEVSAFEQEIAAYVGARDAVAVNSGSSALHLALLAAGVGVGDEVITVPFTFVATVAAIGYTGARVVLVDVEPSTLTMDVSLVERALTRRTKAIVPVHLYGQPADMGPLVDLAGRHGVTVIEDGAQALGSDYRGVRAGSLGRAGCFSFYPTKNLGAVGEAGAVTTSDAALAGRLRELRDWGQDRKAHHRIKGFNYRMDALQAAVLRVKLRYLERWTEARRERARWYDELLTESEVDRPWVAPDRRHVYHLYVVRDVERDRLRGSLAAAGVETAVHYPTPVHLQPAYADLGYGAGTFQVSERASREVLSLPLYPELSRVAVESVAAAVRARAHA